ncbi:unnamed protein product [Leptidea sinapis]|uniref:Uncharacterized protein n=1 Tax=Leptidea sinapis TaxID=189913 RepID=A0A5E4PUL7_9NEOP|nr:unnamed protein product [Leptidea sinapis]
MRLQQFEWYNRSEKTVILSPKLREFKRTDPISFRNQSCYQYFTGTILGVGYLNTNALTRNVFRSIDSVTAAMTVAMLLTNQDIVHISSDHEWQAGSVIPDASSAEIHCDSVSQPEREEDSTPDPGQTVIPVDCPVTPPHAGYHAAATTQRRRAISLIFSTPSPNIYNR